MSFFPSLHGVFPSFVCFLVISLFSPLLLLLLLSLLLVACVSPLQRATNRASTPPTHRPSFPPTFCVPCVAESQTLFSTMRAKPPIARSSVCPTPIPLPCSLFFFPSRVTELIRVLLIRSTGMNRRKEEEYAGSSAISVLCQRQPYSLGFGRREGRQRKGNLVCYSRT